MQEAKNLSKEISLKKIDNEVQSFFLEEIR